MFVKNRDFVGRKFILSLEHLLIKLSNAKNVDKNLSFQNCLDAIGMCKHSQEIQ